MAKNGFQKAVVELNCLLNGYVDQPGDGPTAEEQLKALGGARLIRFLKGNSTTQKGSTGAPSKDCQEGDEDSPVQLSIVGVGHVDGKTLAEAVSKMKALISGSEPASVGSKKK